MKQADHQVTEAQNFPILNFHFYQISLLKSQQQQVLTFTENGPHSCNTFIVHSICTYNKNLNEQLSLSQPTKKKVFLRFPLKAFVSYPQLGLVNMFMTH